MDSQTSRSAWVGAGLALAISLLVIMVAGGSPSKATPSVAPTLQAPTPTLDALSPDNKATTPNTPSASTQVQAQPQATPSKDKESQ